MAKCTFPLLVSFLLNATCAQLLILWIGQQKVLKKEDLHITDLCMQEKKREAMYNGLVGSLKPKEKRHFKLWKCVLTHGLLQLHSIYEYEDVETNISFFCSKMCLQPLRIKLNFPIVLTAPNFYTLCFGSVVLTLLCDIIRLWMHFFDKKSNTPDKIQRSDTHNNDVAELEMEKRSREGISQTEKNRGLPPSPHTSQNKPTNH